MARKPPSKDGVITIKKYANRRLYNTATSSYVTLDDLCLMVKDGLDFVVYDAKSGDDITRSVLTQIIVEEENKGTNLLPIGFLRQLIQFYGDSLQGLLPRYLEQSMNAFIRNQEQMRDYVQNAFGGMFAFNPVEEMSRQNMAMMEHAMRVFSAEGGEGADEMQGPKPGPEAPAKPDREGAAESSKRLDDMQRALDGLQKQLREMNAAKGE
ncbi:MAG: polyhydroxyalkanoate synthesis repressor PhaR [Rhodospirillaceae bacterium]|nr:polyhydroxyalkanoate synthesis repressor PhaR [Rhodospirillaceae bacterium]